MTFLRCCCASDFPPCCWNSWFGNASYQFDVPLLEPLQYGRPAIGGTPGACDSTEAAWSIPACTYGNALYLYQEKLLDCGLPVPDCYVTAGPWTGGIGPTTVTVGGIGGARDFISIASDTACAGAGTFYNYRNAYAVSDYDEGFGTSWYRTLRAVVYKCAIIDSVEYPRTSVLITATFKGKATVTICPGTTGSVNTLSSYTGLYVGDPFTFSDQLSSRVWLKKVQHVDGRWCSTHSGVWSIDPLSLSTGLTAGSHPTNFPEYIDITRTA